MSLRVGDGSRRAARLAVVGRKQQIGVFNQKVISPEEDSLVVFVADMNHLIGCFDDVQPAFTLLLRPLICLPVEGEHHDEPDPGVLFTQGKHHLRSHEVKPQCAAGQEIDVPLADYYCRAMQGSYSIKYVLPALFPDDPELDYHNLEGVHNGTEASAAFERMDRMTPEEQATCRSNLLKYCGLDTLAIVRVWERLTEVIGSNS